jgi:TRAP-type C4-dicarboxylate transport system substrate-binding protein
MGSRRRWRFHAVVGNDTRRNRGGRQNLCDEDSACDGRRRFAPIAKNYAAAVERDSGGRIKAEIYPASQLGSIARQAEGVQFGAIQCQIVAPEFLAGVDERFEVLAAPGLVTSMADGQRVAANLGVMKLMLGLGADKGLHGAGLS